MNEGIRIHMVSLGCARNLVDSEVLLGHVLQEGLQIVEQPELADVVVINTCGFIDAAKEESVDAILSATKLKGTGNLKGVVAVGCLAQRYGEELAAEIPEVDAVLGISDYSGIPALARRIVNGSDRRYVATIDGGAPKAPRTDVGRHLLTPKSFAYLRISEGCNHKCTFCAIPSMRGRNVSKPLEVLVEEAQALAEQGIKELVIVAEDTTAYGIDSHRERRLHRLLEQLCRIDGIEWVRLMYAYPHTVRSELTSVMRGEPKIVPYLDIPIQHISDNMLRAMKRGVSAEQVEGILWRLRDEVPGIAVRTTLITGFPGETEADFEEMHSLVERFRFERMGVFTYSLEEGTPSFEMPNKVPEEVAEERRHQLMTLQREITMQAQRDRVGQEVDVLIDGRMDDYVVGRTKFDAPEVDCVVKLPAFQALRAGDMVRAKITAAEEYDLSGHALGSEAGSSEAGSSEAGNGEVGGEGTPASDASTAPDRGSSQATETP